MKVDFARYDSLGIHSVYDRWPELAAESWNSDPSGLGFGGVDHVVFAGMGGSGTISDIFAAILSETDMHVTVVKGYLLPKTVNANTLIVVTSISGNTAEALSVLEAASRTDAKTVAFSSGGMMEGWSKEHGIRHFSVMERHSPRASLIIFLYSMIRTLMGLLPLDEADVDESLAQLRKIHKKINSANTDGNTSLELARKIRGLPMIYYPAGLQAAAIRFKNSLQENAKLHAGIEDVIEMCHNGIVAWEKDSDVQPVLIEGEDDHARTKERWGIIKEYFAESGVPCVEIRSPSGSILTKLVGLVYVLDYASIYHAVINRVDPTPIRSIDFVKESLKRA